MRLTALKKLLLSCVPEPPLPLIDGQLIDAVCTAECLRHQAVIDLVLQSTSGSAGQGAGQEQALPGNPEFMRSGHYRTMLKRYLFAGAFFCRRKRVIDSCCGLGWGTFLLAQYAGSIVAFDRSEQALAFCRHTWKAPQVTWRLEDALGLDAGVHKEKFDVACAMETIEHFSREDGEQYLGGLAGVLNACGVLIGTSSFPADRTRADALCARNPHHVYIYTEPEMYSVLAKYFSRYVIIDNWMFIARK